MRAWRGLAVLSVALCVLTGCEGTTTGTQVVNVALQPAEQPTERGAFVPVKFNLSTDMNPIAINFRADFSQDATEFGKWNTYRVALTQNGNTVASRNMNVNHPQSNAQGDAPPPTSTVHTMFITDLQSSGEFELTITPVKPVAITLRNATVDVRRNVARPPT